MKPGDVRGYDEGEQYISMWVHTIEDTPEGEAYKKSVERFNEKYDGTYFADIEFIPRNDSGGGYSDKINASVGGDLVSISEDGLTADGYFNSDKNAAVFQYFRGLVENKYMSATPIENLFESGRAAFKFDGAWEVNTIYQSYSDIDLGVAPYIVSDNWDGGRYTPTGSWAYAATTKTEHIEAATELVKWMSGVDSGVLLYENTKSMPSTYAAYDQITAFEEDENYKALYEQLRDYGHPRPKTPVYPQVSTSFQQVLEDVGLSGKDVQTEMNQSIERINAKLERYTR